MQLFPQRNIPRVFIFIGDVVVCAVSIWLAYLLRFNFRVPQHEIDLLLPMLPVFFAVRVISFYFYKTYTGIIRYTSTRDASRILLTLATGSLSIGLLNPVFYYFNSYYVLPFSVIIIDFLLSVFIMTSTRLLIKVAYMEMRNPTSEKTGVIIYGAGDAGMITKRTLDRDTGSKYKVIAFIDDDKKKVGNKIEGIPIYHARKDLEGLLTANRIKHLIISIQEIAPLRKQEIVDTCLRYDTKVLNVPPIKTWINGELSFKQIKKVKIEDLLGRDAIQLDTEKIKADITGKTILVTGAAGSIGSEIVRQIIPFNPAMIVMLDMAESPLHELEVDLSEMNDVTCNYEAVIGDIRNMERMRNVYYTFKPHIVFHAAAYKHVPMMEHNPSEGILNNVLGTKVIADLAVEFKVQKFVMISTDKAVNPTNIMGATKRIAEMYTQVLNRTGSTRFITTRFGNVMGSNGSVLPRFKKQIDLGLPLTVTHPDVTRFFMTISEACQLVLEAGAMGNGGEIFIFDMGESVRIADIAKQMIQLSGLELGKDIQIVYTGLRHGEKLYEELLANEENALPTHHRKIMIARVKENNLQKVTEDVKELIGLFSTQNNISIVRKMKEMIPEFISNNSEFEKLDA